MYAVITTANRGVFGGEVEQYGGGRAILTNARMCVYWSPKTRGVVGLAAHGPQPGSRVTPAAPRVELEGVTARFDCTPEAQAAWESEPWE